MEKGQASCKQIPFSGKSIELKSRVENAKSIHQADSKPFG
jgi:hypothetical protein